MPDEELVLLRTYQWYDEAKVAESVLVAEGIPCELYEENMLASRPLAVVASGGMRLMVPVSRAEEALALLEASTLSDEELAAQAERLCRGTKIRICSGKSSFTSENSISFCRNAGEGA